MFAKSVLVVALSIATVCASVHTPSPAGATVWSTPADFNVSQWGDPVIANNTVFVVAENANAGQHTIFASSMQSGAMSWSSKTFKGAGLYLAVGQGLLFHVDPNGVYAFNQTSGEAVWSVPNTFSVNPKASGGWTGKPTYTPGVLFVTWYNTGMVSFDASSGKVLHVTNYTVGSRVFASTDGAALSFFSISVQGTYSLVRASAKSFGATVYWNDTYSASYASLVASDTTLVTLSAPVDSNMVQLVLGVDAYTGHYEWTYTAIDASPRNTNFDFNIGPKNAYTIYQDQATSSTLVAHDSLSGYTAFKARIATTDSSINLAYSGGVVFVVAYTTGYVWAYDGSNGALLWEKTAPTCFYGVADSDSNLYFMGTGNNFVAVTLRNQQ